MSLTRNSGLVPGNRDPNAKTTIHINTTSMTDQTILSELLSAFWYRIITEINSKRMNWYFVIVSLPALGKDRTSDYRA